MAGERALAASATPEGGSLRIDVKLRGDFPPGAEQNFERLALSVAQSPLGQLLGLGDVRVHGVRVPAASALMAVRSKEAASP